MFKELNIKEIQIDETISQILKVTGVKAFEASDGEIVFGYYMSEDSTWLMVSSAENGNRVAGDNVWVASRVDEAGRGFKISEQMKFHDALVQTFKLPSPILYADDERSVIDMVVSDDSRAKAIRREVLENRDNLDNTYKFG